ncbi:MAG: addiction module antidote protein [Alkalispirochaeta sp.]
MRTFRDLVTEHVQDPAQALEYLNASLELFEQDSDLDSFLTAIRTVVDANGGMTKLAQETDLNRQHLYRSLSRNGNPTIRTLESVLRALGLRLTIKKAS